VVALAIKAVGGRGGSCNGRGGATLPLSTGTVAELPLAGDFPYPTEGLTFLGFLSISDPPREGARAAVLAIRAAGIVTAMVTGDSADTALSIARSVGIVDHRRTSQGSSGRSEDSKVSSPLHDGSDSDGDDQPPAAAATARHGETKRNGGLTAATAAAARTGGAYAGVDVVPATLLAPRLGQGVAGAAPGIKSLLDLKPLQERAAGAGSHGRGNAGSSGSSGGVHGEDDGVLDVEHGVPFTFYAPAGVGAGPAARAGARRRPPAATAAAAAAAAAAPDDDDGYATDDTAGYVEDVMALNVFCAQGTTAPFPPLPARHLPVPH